MLVLLFMYLYYLFKSGFVFVGRMIFPSWCWFTALRLWRGKNSPWDKTAMMMIMMVVVVVMLMLVDSIEALKREELALRHFLYVGTKLTTYRRFWGNYFSCSTNTTNWKKSTHIIVTALRAVICIKFWAHLDTEKVEKKIQFNFKKKVNLYLEDFHAICKIY